MSKPSAGSDCNRCMAYFTTHVLGDDGDGVFFLFVRLVGAGDSRVLRMQLTVPAPVLLNGVCTGWSM